MDAKAAAKLYQAERDGVRQITGRLSDNLGGLCALGGIGARQLMTLAEWKALSLGLDPIQCPACEYIAKEIHLISHLNDVHRWSFSEIARKLGPDHA
jgi:hypothetical protein